MTGSPKTVFLAPGWECQAGSVLLGSVFTNPSQPQLALFKPSPGDIDTTVKTSEKATFAASIDPAGDSRPGLFRTFLRLFGVGDEEEVHYDRKTVEWYSFRGLRTESFVPSEALKHKALAQTDRVAQFCRASDYKASVYMVTGIKTIEGAGVKAPSRKRTGWHLSINVDAPSWNEPSEQEAPGESPSVVFAFELLELKLSAAGETIDVGDGSGSATGSTADAQKTLELEFGEAALTVVEGFDEEDDVHVRIVASSPAGVDLLTAGSARIGSRHY
ncbi:hypothetical protein B0T24DRAFT_615407 [Lasiosphaeria ovina]|uniref:Uncharacterized protein n=1 Tax=Lasiosphaeria ovina TaxID=92902 RepID=A0AAE0TUS0_9PEZI|nr:hypothetical protein B0T24DRAFT_615407 [Lasiosphaeria ovina]